MKTSKRLKAITLILVIVLITILSFLGVYNIGKIGGDNLVKDYNVGMELKGRRVLRLKVDDTVNTVFYDNDGNEVKEADKKEDVEYTEKKEPVNEPEKLTKENYKKAKDIIERRLSSMDAEEYKIRFNEENGTIELEMIDDELTDYAMESTRMKGDFRIIDDETEEILMDRSLVKRAKVVYSSGDSGKTTTYLDIEFTKEGSKKLEEISQKYIQTTEQVTDENGNTTDKTVEKKISVKVDDTKIISTHFGETLTNGHLYISVGQATTDNEQLREYALEASIYAAIIETDTLPVEYVIEQNNLIIPNTNKTIIPLVAIITLAIEVVVLVVMFKSKGLLASILQLGYVALLLLIIKYTNVYITIEGIFSIVIMSHINTIFIAKILHDSNKDGSIIKAINENLVKFINISIPVLIIAIVFCFAKWLEINSFGMVIFWGYVVSLLYNILFTKGILKNIM